MRKRIVVLLFLSLILGGQSKNYGNVRPKVSFNHLYHVFDHETFADILASDFIKNEFAGIDTGLPNFAAPQSDAGNLYLRGKNTYLEILGVNNRFKEPLGKGGMAFAVDNQGELQTLYQSLNRLSPAVFEISLTTRDFPNAPKIPWYLSLYRRSDKINTVDWWVTEYKAEFFLKTFSPNNLKNSDVSRARYLRRHYNAGKLLSDVTRISVALPREQKDFLAADLQKFGFTIAKSENEKTILRGNNFEVSIFTETPFRTGILSIGMKLNRKVSRKQVYKFGAGSTLTLQNRFGLWIF